jgi:hypothetical protein
MSVFGNFNDLSNQIIREGDEISIVFTNNGDGTGTITWNIPPPANGCSADSQAYDGIVITASLEAANYITTSPKNKVRYTADPTLNFTASLGDRLDTAWVVGAFYNDKTTTSLTVTDVDPTKWYHVSGYAVDNVGTYHREGVHAYSLPTGSEGGEEHDYAAHQNIIIIPNDGTATSNGKTLTGLVQNQVYTFTLRINEQHYKIKINGYNALSYEQLIKAINLELQKIHRDAYVSPVPPNTGRYYIDMSTMSLFQWNGSENIPEGMVVFDQDPSLAPQGTYWFNPTTGIISLYETGGWHPQTLINLDHAPNQPTCGELWFTGTDVYEWDGDHWIQLCLYVQTTNPQLAPVLDCNTYWYDTTSGLMYKWATDNEVWYEVTPIVGSQDPNTLGVGSFWLDETNGLMYRYSAGAWNQLLECRYDTTTPTNPAPNVYWYNPTTQLFQKRDPTNTFWTPYTFTMYPTDPTIRKSNDLWWNQSDSVDTLYVWDIVNMVWLPVVNFYQTAIDPSLPPNLPPCVVWWNPTTQVLTYIIKGGCVDKQFISSLTDPTRPQFDTVWYDTATNSYYVWNGSAWEEIYPIISTYDPFVMYNGYFWYDPTDNLLKMWNGTTWITTPYVTQPFTPHLHERWFNSATNEMYEWDGNSWVPAEPIAYVVMKYTKSTNPDYNDKAFLQFRTTAKGCCHFIELIPAYNELFTMLRQSVIYGDPVPGNNGVKPGESYEQLGVGTNGRPDTRRQVHDYIRQFLGFPTVQVELFKTQIDAAIDTALLLVRKYSGFGYTRNYFFLDLKPNQQTYLLTDRCVGFNKITSIKEINRMRAGWIRTAFAGNELFGIAALQQLYTVGTFDMLSFHLMSSYIKELEMLFANRIVYQFTEETRQLRIFQQVLNPERVLLDAMIERSEQDLMANRETSIWIKKWALAEAKEILGNGARGKYQQLAGPNGSTSLNADQLLSQSQAEKAQLMIDMYDPAMQNYNEVGMNADLAIG